MPVDAATTASDEDGIPVATKPVDPATPSLDDAVALRKCAELVSGAGMLPVDAAASLDVAPVPMRVEEEVSAATKPVEAACPELDAPLVPLPKGAELVSGTGTTPVGATSEAEEDPPVAARTPVDPAMPSLDDAVVSLRKGAELVSGAGTMPVEAADEEPTSTDEEDEGSWLLLLIMKTDPEATGIEETASLLMVALRKGASLDEDVV